MWLLMVLLDLFCVVLLEARGCDETVRGSVPRCRDTVDIVEKVTVKVICFSTETSQACFKLLQFIK